MRKRKAWKWTILGLVLLLACETTDHEGFKRVDNSIHLKWRTLGDESRAVTAERIVSLSVRLRNLAGDDIALKKVDRVRFEEGHWPRPIADLLLNKGEGDEFLIRGRLDELMIRDWFAPVVLGADDAVLELEVVVNEVLTEEELRQRRAQERVATDNELEGLRCLSLAKDSLGFTDADFQDGIYFRSLKPGRGARPESGKLARVHYKTYLCDGSMVDDTYRAEEFEYPIGKPDQVLPGFGVAIARMRVGETALFIVPSALAFGERGSSSGLVPPHTALIYEATLLELR